MCPIVAAVSEAGGQVEYECTSVPASIDSAGTSSHRGTCGKGAALGHRPEQGAMLSCLKVLPCEQLVVK